ncbi:MAG TPA: hypothetical protein VGH28_13170 [Polyangiaceae bacterium]|jgi:hypothetical protein
MKLRMLALALTVVACTMDTAPTGLAATPAGDGPVVVFDLLRRPLPEIPAPNDVATFADPTSRTGRRINVSLVAPTDLEEDARQGFAEMEGWGTFAPISVSFTRGKGIAPTEAAIDLDAVRARMQRDGYDTTNDPVYVINLTTGVPALLDADGGAFPKTIRDQDLYYPNDPRIAEQNFLLETAEEGAGLSQDDYTPALDTDFDGVLDHPDTLASLERTGGGHVHGVDDLLTFYERETDTLLLRPIIPLAEKTEYAVVLTDRLRDTLGRPVRSPFPVVYHPSQETSIRKLQNVLSDASRANYYGDVAGSGLGHVAFAWTFTTAPVTEDLLLLRDGLFGQGPFAHLAKEYPPTMSAYRTAGLVADSTLAGQPAGWQDNPTCAISKTHPYIVRIDDIKDTLSQVIDRVFSLPDDQLAALVASFDSIDHIVIGSYPLAYFLGPDPAHEDPTDRFQVNYRTGQGRFSTDMGHFWLTVPKTNAAKNFVQPFPTVVWGHGSTLNGAEIMIRAGYFARQGLAMLGFDGPGHGLALDGGTKLLLQGLLYNTCLVPWSVGLEAGRAHDLDGDGLLDPGGLLWTAHIFHSRDNIRQTVLDGIQASRVLRTFDGRTGDQDYDDDGKPNVLGDFDTDGVPDVGGSAPIFSSGDSYGGIFTMIHTALDPNVTAGGSISGGGGLTDVASRSFGVVDSVIEQLITPLVVAVPASSRPHDGNSTGSATLCASGQMSVRMVVNDLIQSREVEVACLDKAELSSGMTVLVRNARNDEKRCARTLADGSFRVPIPATAGDDLQIQVYDAPDVVDSYGTCNIVGNPPAGRTITTFEQRAAAYRSVGDSTATCDDPGGCQQYRDTFYPVGSQLVAPQSGLGLRRQTPDIRKLLQLTQAAVDPSDPINFARLYMLSPNPGPDGTPQGPKGFLTSNTVADGFVVVATGHAFARAAGALPFLPPDAMTRLPDYADWVTPPAIYQELGDRTPSDALADSYVIEGDARLDRAPAISCGLNYKANPACSSPAPQLDPNVCAQTVFDPDWHAEGRDGYGAQHFPVPLRLARRTDVRIASGDDLTQGWSPRLLGAPFTSDGGWTPDGTPLLGLMDAYVNPLGQHVWTTSDPCKAWDDAVYYDHALARFLASSGSDLYYLSHPATHACMADQSCDFLK